MLIVLNKLPLNTLSIIGLLFSVSAFSSELDFETVKDLIQNRGANSIEKLLEKLPSDYRENFTLMYSSRSIQGSSYENPRAILFGKSAKFIMTFNGDASQRGNDRLEMLQFRDETKQFELRSVTFRNGTAEFLDKNPTMCIKCHGTNPRPIWADSPVWPGAYGAMDDRVINAETSNFQNFIKKMDSHPRYKYLVRRTDLSQNFPFRDQDESSLTVRANERLGRLFDLLR